MMKCLTCVLMVGLVVSAARCQTTQDAELVRSEPIEKPAETEASRPAASAVEPAGAITIADVLEALDMEIWKEKVNQPGGPPIKHVALCVKPARSEAREVMSIDIKDPAQPGTLLVFLQEGRWGEFRFRTGIVYHGEGGFGHSTLGVVDDPFKDPGVRTGGGGSIAHPGVVVLRCNGSFMGTREAIETTAEAAAIYVKSE
jgi:hypothetical protein